MIEFTTDPTIRHWSQFVFYFAVINTIATILFTVVVIIGGIFDVRFLIHALKTEKIDVTDNGQVRRESDNDATATPPSSSTPGQTPEKP